MLKRRTHRGQKTPPPATAKAVTDQRLAAGFPAATASVEVATTALLDGFARRDSPVEMRSLHRALTRALDQAILAAEAELRLALGPTVGLSHTQLITARSRPTAQAWRRDLDRLRTSRQKHLLVAAGPAFGAVTPVYAPARTMTGMGPFWPETDYLPETVIYRRKILMPLMER
jgi:hypothetical protein